MRYDQLMALAEINTPDHPDTAARQMWAAGGDHMLHAIKVISDELAARAVVTGNIYRPAFWVQSRDRGLFFNLEPNRIETGPYPEVYPVI